MAQGEEVGALAQRPWQDHLLEGPAPVSQPSFPHGTVTNSRDLSQFCNRIVPGGDALATMIEVLEVSEEKVPGTHMSAP